jgi:hypothetical protein
VLFTLDGRGEVCDVVVCDVVFSDGAADLAMPGGLGPRTGGGLRRCCCRVVAVVATAMSGLVPRSSRTTFPGGGVVKPAPRAATPDAGALMTAGFFMITLEIFDPSLDMLILRVYRVLRLG